ncbi:MAG: M36 family metallopeptidase [Saprospiraceae bacterium]|uniref:M36 family metallopeptidase n=1 Tax=Candidatus Opimibacter skivensis TaxID=2982028 RepID=A0A9D7T0V2_9BACT|nr:M36 family metallopeptidase [Candidatus Opimibacter skivensis]
MIRILLFSIIIFSSASFFAQPTLPDIPALLDQHKNEFGLSPVDIAEFSISNAYITDHLQITHVYLEQRYQDIRVFNGILNLNLSGDRLVSYGNRWINGLYTRAPSAVPDITAQSAVARSASDLGHNFPNAIEINKEQNKKGQYTKVIFKGDGLSQTDITAELMWLDGESKNVFLCWKVEIAEIDNENIWDIFIDAHSGAFIRKDNMVMHCSFDLPTGNVHKQEDCTTVPLQPESPLMVTPDSSYNIFSIPIESPNHGPRSIVTRPWTSCGVGNHASTLGWHKDGTTNYRITRGNNVYAYEDINHDNLPGYSPDTINLRFDYPYTPSINAADNLASCITNLFYWNNIMHDVTYQYGFDEVSGNFQNNNLSRGGAGGDYVKAEAQDGGGTNNANFSTPADGSSGRMQMYLWSPVSGSSPLTINSPASIAGSIWSVESAFSTANKLVNVGAKTGNLLLVNDTGASTHLGCGTLSNGASLPGKIAVIDRGTCDFVTKVKNAQNLGAIAAIVINNVTGSPFAMNGTDNTITIPAVMISLEDGNALKAVMIGNTVNATLAPVPLTTPDGDFDSGVICHEYGHGVSTRLTGGPSNVSCLNNQEQMGEGWSDYFGLMLTTHWNTATANDQRGIGTYVIGEPPGGTGIRTYPYTRDITVNPFTYADVAGAPSGSVHYIGSIWATMLWDMTWNIIDMAGVSTDVYHGTAGNNIAMQLVMDGLKLQPCNPGFVDGRDAILLADQLNYGGLYHCAIWNAFARRGLGVSASQGSSNSYTDGVAAYNIPDKVTIKGKPNASIAGEGQDISFSLKATCQCVGKSNLDISDVLSADLNYIPGSGGTQSANTIHFNQDTLAPRDSVEFTYHAFVNPCSALQITTLNTENAEATAQYVSIKLTGTGTKVWVKSTAQAVSPTHSWYAQDYTSVSDYVLKLINPVSTTNGLVEIGFYHRYNTEAIYDGGVVEYSVNGGTTWLDAGPYFTERGYPSAITSGTNSTIAGRPAFTGNSDTQFGASGFIHSTIRLVLGGPQSLLIRFRMATDGGVGGSGINGWYIDDIVIKQISGSTNKSRVADNGLVIDSMYYALQTTQYVGHKIYVDSSADGNLSGTSWLNAMHYLPMAIGVTGCRLADSILVAKGTYLPGLTNSRTQSFNIPDSTSVFGGFPTGGSTFALRDPVTNVTQLSGDLGILNNNSDNSYHVVKIDSAKQNILLDGLTLKNGNANGVGDNSSGAAVFCLGKLTMQNVTIRNSVGLSDGELIRIRNAAAQLKLKDCTLHGPTDGKVKVMNINGAQLVIQGNTMILEE